MNLLLLLLPSLAVAQPLPCGFAHQVERGPDRPVDTVTSVESATLPITVHYDPFFTPDPAPLLAEIERAWGNNVEWGLFEPPADDFGPDDRFDVYVSETEFGGYVAPEDWWQRQAGVGCYSHMVLNRKIALEGLLSIIHHEMHHAFQTATDCVESVGLLESDATFVQDWTLPETPYGLLAFVPAFQSTPERPTHDAEWGLPWQYGASLWRWFLAERFGDGTPSFSASLWLAGEQPGFENEPDWLDVLDEVLAAEGTTPAEAFDEFSIWRLLVGQRTSKHSLFARASQWPVDEITLQVQAQYGAATLPLVDQAGPVGAGPFGSVYIELTSLPGPGELVAGFEPDNAGIPWAVTLLVVQPDGAWEVLPLVDGEAAYSAVGDESAFLIANNVTPHDPDEYEDFGAQRATFRWSLDWIGEGDDDDAADDDDAGDDDDAAFVPPGLTGGNDCSGCSAAGGGSWLALGLLGVRRRR